MLILRSFNRFILISLALLGLSVSSAQASLVKSGSIITDSDSGLEWYAVDATTGFSYNQMLSNFGDSNSDYFGFSYAPLTTIKELWNHAGYNHDFISLTSSVSDIAAVDLMYDLFGQTGTDCCDRGDAMFRNDNGGKIDFLSYITDDAIQAGNKGSGAHVRPFNNFWGADDVDWPTNAANSMGSWIYRKVSPVPVPAAIWLFGTALIGFVGMSRRRKVA